MIPQILLEGGLLATAVAAGMSVVLTASLIAMGAGEAMMLYSSDEHTLRTLVCEDSLDDSDCTYADDDDVIRSPCVMSVTDSAKLKRYDTVHMDLQYLAGA